MSHMIKEMKLQSMHSKCGQSPTIYAVSSTEAKAMARVVLNEVQTQLRELMFDTKRDHEQVFKKLHEIYQEVL